MLDRGGQRCDDSSVVAHGLHQRNCRRTVIADQSNYIDAVDKHRGVWRTRDRDGVVGEEAHAGVAMCIAQQRTYGQQQQQR